MKASFSIFFALFFFFSSFHHSQALPRHSLDNSTDQLALLSFKSHITSDPNAILNTWNPNTSFCNWEGVLCNPMKNRVTGLALGNLTLVGTITPDITNLSFLHLLDLHNNKFSGSLPIEFGKLFRLKTLNLSSNLIHGTIPSSLGQCSRLRSIDLFDNQLEGTMSAKLGLLSELQVLRFAENNLTGSIPSSFGNLSSLTKLILLSNNLQGSIPIELGSLHQLLILQLGLNNIAGDMPASLFNLSSLRFMSLTGNQISGRLPSNLFFKFPNLTQLYVSDTLLEGTIPASLSNASNLQILDLSQNQLTGTVPLLWNLPNLERLNLEVNQLVSESKNGLNFIASLTNSTLLQVFSVASNQLTGRLPFSIGNFSSELYVLLMGGNHFDGNVPEEIGNLGSLIMLALELNSISGQIPSTIGKLHKLQKFRLHSNFFSGPIPDTLGNLTELYDLSLANNNLTGRIPSRLSDCKYLQNLDLSLNRLNGDIPKEILGYPSLGYYLNLSFNSLTGSLHTEIGNLKSVQEIDISKNQLTGTIPTTIGDCSNLLYLDLSENSFQGPIPDSLANLKGLEYVDLSSNNFSGLIPSSLDSLQFLELLNLSGNQLQGEVPKSGIFMNSTVVSLTGNAKLCGGVPKLGLPDCVATKRRSNRSETRLIIGLVVASTTFCILMGLGFLSYSCYKKTQQKPMATEVILFENPHPLYTYYDLRAATNNVSLENFIGEGSFGSVYKGVLSDRSLVAIKVFNMDQHGASKSFLAECEALRNVRHRNLIKILSACSSSEYKALVLQFMPNGSLEKYLHKTSGSQGEETTRLNIQQRLEIAIDVANAIEYLHHDCETPVVHCDLKPSNVLLDENMTAYVADFGISRMLYGTTSNRHLSSTFVLKGSIGYIAPEYGLGAGVSTKGDVYSYGILLLEMFSGKRPTNELFPGELNLQKWVARALPDRVMEILDVELVKEGEVWNNDYFVSIIKIGLSCASETPEERPNMKDVAAMIKKARNMLANEAH